MLRRILYALLLAFALPTLSARAEEAWTWRTDVDNVKAEAARDGKLIVTVFMFYRDCGYCRAFFPIAHDAEFLAWAEKNGVYLVTADYTLHSDTQKAKTYFWKLYRQNPVSPNSGLPPLVVVARASAPDKLVGYGVMRSGRSFCGGTFQGTAQSLISCLTRVMPDGDSASTGGSTTDGGATGGTSQDAVDQNTFTTATTPAGAVFDGDNLVGTLNFKIGRRSPGKGCKVSGWLTTLEGRKVKLLLNASTIMPKGEEMAIPFRVTLSTGTLSGQATVTERGTVSGGAIGNSYEIGPAAIGGSLKSSAPAFRLERAYAANEIPGALGTVETDAAIYMLQPVQGEPIAVAGTRWACAKAAGIKYVRDRQSGNVDLVVDTSRGRTNLCGLKLSYTAKTGLFKGTFTVYANGGTETKPRLQKGKATVKGLVVNGVGHGVSKIRGAADHVVVVE